MGCTLSVIDHNTFVSFWHITEKDSSQSFSLPLNPQNHTHSKLFLHKKKVWFYHVFWCGVHHFSVNFISFCVPLHVYLLLLHIDRWVKRFVKCEIPWILNPVLLRGYSMWTRVWNYGSMSITITVAWLRMNYVVFVVCKIDDLFSHGIILDLNRNWIESKPLLSLPCLDIVQWTFFRFADFAIWDWSPEVGNG